MLIPNSLTITTLMFIIWAHLFSDFFLQTDKMAINKSTSNKWLTIHVLVYIIPFWIFCGPLYAGINFILHFITDYISSRCTSYLWKKDQRHWFFTVIGIDQALHMTALILTIPFIT